MQDEGLKLSDALESRLGESQKLGLHLNRCLLLLALNRQEACAEATGLLAAAHPGSHLVALVRAAALARQGKVRQPAWCKQR